MISLTGIEQVDAIRALSSYEEYEACAALQDLIWGERYVGFCSPVLQWAAQATGGVCAGAFDQQGSLVGFVMGLTGLWTKEAVHWSHMLAVRPEFRCTGIGLRLKLFQRSQLLPRGVKIILSSFDPLNSAQANLLLSKLGAEASIYKPDFYPTSHSPLHGSIGTDRLISAWSINSSEVADKIERAISVGSGLDQQEPDWLSAPLINRVYILDASTAVRKGLCLPEQRYDIPLSDASDLTLQSPRLRLCIPFEIQRLQKRMPAVAADWRMKTRMAFEVYLPRGYKAVALWGHPPFSSYLLSREPSLVAPAIELILAGI